MDIFSCQEAFGAADKTTAAMRQALSQWLELYYRDTDTDGENPCQRIAYTVVSKLVRTVFPSTLPARTRPLSGRCWRRWISIRKRRCSWRWWAALAI